MGPNDDETAGSALQRWYSRSEPLALGAFGVGITLAIWELLAALGLIRPVLLSRPSAVYAVAVAEVTTAEFWVNVWATLSVWLVGLLIGCAIGILVGLLAGWYATVRMVANPWLNVLDSVPTLALVPIFIIWLGIGATFKIVLVFLAVFFYVAVNTMTGVLSLENRHLAVAKSFGASQALVFRSVVIPGSVPYIVTGFRQGASRGLVTAVAAEFISSHEGIGHMIHVAGATVHTAKALFGLVVLAALGIVVGQVLGRFEQKFDAWRTS